MKKAFTLVELVIVIAIIMILTTVFSIKLSYQKRKANDASAIAFIGVWRSANYLFYSDNEFYPLDFITLKDKVDKTVVLNTFSDENNSPFNGSSVQWLKAGTVTNRDDKMVSIVITGTSLESNINFEVENGNDTKGNAWINY